MLLYVQNASDDHSKFKEQHSDFVFGIAGSTRELAIRLNECQSAIYQARAHAEEKRRPQAVDKK